MHNYALLFHAMYIVQVEGEFMDFNNNYYSEQQETGQQIPVQPPVQQPVQQNPNPVPPKNALSIASLIIGIIALATFWTIIGGIVLGSLAIILAVLSKGYYKKMNGTAKGGFITGLIALIIEAAIYIFAIVALIIAGANYKVAPSIYDYNEYDYYDGYDYDDFDYDDYEFDYDDYEFDYDDFDYEDFDF